MKGIESESLNEYYVYNEDFCIFVVSLSLNSV